MKKLNYIFIGGKQLGYNCLNFLLKKKNKPIFLVPNLDDNGKDNIFNKSIKKLAKKKKIRVMNLNNLSRILDKKKIIIDVIFCLGSSQIIPKKILKKSTLGALNIHPSLLPEYRGRYSIPHAIFAGEKYSGISSHWIGQKIDTGRVISQVKIKIKNEDTAETIYKKFTSIATAEFRKLYFRIIKNINFKYKKIDFKSSKYKKKSLPNNGIIDWRWSGEKIFRFIRSMLHEPFPPPKLKIGLKDYFIVSEKYLDKKKFIKSPK